LPRSFEKRPTRLRLEIETERHSKCNRLYYCESVLSRMNEQEALLSVYRALLSVYMVFVGVYMALLSVCTAASQIYYCEAVWSYGVASVSRIDKIIGLFCKTAL